MAMAILAQGSKHRKEKSTSQNLRTPHPHYYFTMATERWLSSKAFELEQGASALSQARDAWADKAAQGHANITDFSDVVNAVVANQLSMGFSVIALAQALREDKTQLVQHIREQVLRLGRLDERRAVEDKPGAGGAGQRVRGGRAPPKISQRVDNCPDGACNLSPAGTALAAVAHGRRARRDRC